jgi:hypothetical protein
MGSTCCRGSRQGGQFGTRWDYADYLQPGQDLFTDRLITNIETAFEFSTSPT